MPTTLDVPPTPPDLSHLRRGFGGGDNARWKRWLALAMVVAMTIYVSWFAIKAFRWQPVATVISIVWATVSSAIAYRKFYVSIENRMSRLVLRCLIGGCLAELIQIVASRRLSIGILWIAIGILGIGGGFGVGSFSLVGFWYSTIALAKLLWRWRAA